MGFDVPQDEVSNYGVLVAGHYMDSRYCII
jgi:hypothetical protein